MFTITEAKTSKAAQESLNAGCWVFRWCTFLAGVTTVGFGLVDVAIAYPPVCPIYGRLSSGYSLPRAAPAAIAGGLRVC